MYGLAHVDTPKGDLDMSGGITGADHPVVDNSFNYPYGTTEQFPQMEDTDLNVLTNSAHYYMECSNKGTCDRSTGDCSCFDGYDGVACQRASCPSGAAGVCSGHGVCMTAAQIASSDSSNTYRLWDKSTTMGCKCDAGYYGPSCAEKKCKYGVDPLYLDDSATVKYSTWDFATLTTAPAAATSETMSYYHTADGVLLNDGTATGGVGYWAIRFFDYSGEDWVTAPIAAGASCSQVVAALEALPNNVIPAGNTYCTRSWNIGQQDDEWSTTGGLGDGLSGQTLYDAQHPATSAHPYKINYRMSIWDAYASSNAHEEVGEGGLYTPLTKLPGSFSKKPVATGWVTVAAGSAVNYFSTDSPSFEEGMLLRKITSAGVYSILGTATKVDYSAPLSFTGTATSASTTLTLNAATGIVAGVYVTGNGIASGTTVASISGTVVTLSTATTAAITSSTGMITFNAAAAWTVSFTGTASTFTAYGHQVVGQYPTLAGTALTAPTTSSVVTTTPGFKAGMYLAITPAAVFTTGNCATSTTLNVVSATGIVAGMFVSGPGIAVGATVSSVAGTAVTLSTACLATIFETSGTISFTSAVGKGTTLGAVAITSVTQGTTIVNSQTITSYTLTYASGSAGTAGDKIAGFDATYTVSGVVAADVSGSSTVYVRGDLGWSNDMMVGTSTGSVDQTSVILAQPPLTATVTTAAATGAISIVTAATCPTDVPNGYAISGAGLYSGQYVTACSSGTFTLSAPTDGPISVGTNLNLGTVTKITVTSVTATAGTAISGSTFYAMGADIKVTLTATGELIGGHIAMFESTYAVASTTYQSSFCGPIAAPSLISFTGVTPKVLKAATSNGGTGSVGTSFVSTPAANVASGVTSFSVVNAYGITVGMSAYLSTKVASGTTVVSVKGNVITLSAATSGSMTSASAIVFTPSTTVASTSLIIGIVKAGGFTTGMTVAGAGIPEGTTITCGIHGEQAILKTTVTPGAAYFPFAAVTSTTTTSTINAPVCTMSNAAIISTGTIITGVMPISQFTAAYGATATTTAAISVTSSTASITLTAATVNSNIVVGMGVTGTNIAAGTYVSAIAGTALTLSAAPTAATGTGTLSFYTPAIAISAVQGAPVVSGTYYQSAAGTALTTSGLFLYCPVPIAIGGSGNCYTYSGTTPASALPSTSTFAATTMVGSTLFTTAATATVPCLITYEYTATSGPADTATTYFWPIYNGYVVSVQPDTATSSSNSVLVASPGLAPGMSLGCYTSSGVTSACFQGVRTITSVHYDGSKWRVSFTGAAESMLTTYTLVGSYVSPGQTETTRASLTGYIYRIKFYGNPGKLKQPEIVTHLDGKRNSLMSVNYQTTAPGTNKDYRVITKVWTDGQQGEASDYFANHCDGVQVTIGNKWVSTVDGVVSVTTDPTADQNHNTQAKFFLSSLTATEKALLKTCLGGSDFDSTNNKDVYNWDWGYDETQFDHPIRFPHMIKLVRSVTTYTDGGYYAALYYVESDNLDSLGSGGTFYLLNPFSPPDAFATDSYEVYTTTGVLALTSSSVAASFGFGSKTIYTVDPREDPTQGTAYAPDASTTATMTIGSSSITVASGTGITAGMSATGLGIPSNALVTSVSGTTVGISLAALQTLSSVPVYFTKSGNGDLSCEVGLSDANKAVQANWPFWEYNNIKTLTSSSVQAACLNKTDLITLINPDFPAMNPPHLNLYTVTRLRKTAPTWSNTARWGAPATTASSYGENSYYTKGGVTSYNRQGAAMTYMTNQISVDIATNWGASVGSNSAANAGSAALRGLAETSSFRVYKFYPDKASTYNYVAPCSNRGLCDHDTGVCSCFAGYTNDDCHVQSSLAL
jgi:hypothetical protein